MQCVVRVKKGEEKAKEGAAPVPGRRKKVSKKQQQQGKEQQRRKPKSAAAAAVDEDLYKISPNVICKVQKASSYNLIFFSDFWVLFFLSIARRMCNQTKWIYFGCQRKTYGFTFASSMSRH
jgi:hypothetical protein